jgi:hypothetical protein
MVPQKLSGGSFPKAKRQEGLEGRILKGRNYVGVVGGGLILSPCRTATTGGELVFVPDVP